MRGHPVKVLCAGLYCALVLNHLERGDMLCAVLDFVAMVGWLVSAWGDDA